MTDETEITDRELLDRLASWLVERRMAAPAILFLESHRPLSFVGSQAMVAASPIVHIFEGFFQALAGPAWQHGRYERFADLMSDRDNVERLIVAIERRSQETKVQERALKARRKAERRAARGGPRGWRFWRRRDPSVGDA